MVFCGQCGAKCVGEGGYCLNCGAKLFRSGDVIDNGQTTNKRIESFPQPKRNQTTTAFRESPATDIKKNSVWNPLKSEGLPSFYLIAICVVSCILALILFIYSLSVGSYEVSFGKVISVLFGMEPKDSMDHVVVMEYRLPRAFSVFLAVPVLGAVTVVLNEVFSKKYLDPSVLGLSTPALLGSYAFIGVPIVTTIGFSVSGGMAVGFALVCLMLLKVKKIKVILLGLTVSFVSLVAWRLIHMYHDGQSLSSVVMILGTGDTAMLSALPPLAIIVFLGILFLSLLIYHSTRYGSKMREPVVLILCTVLCGMVAGAVVNQAGLMLFSGIIVYLLTVMLAGSDIRRAFPVTLSIGALLGSVLTLINMSINGLVIGEVTAIIGGFILFVYFIIRNGDSDSSTE